ncbi:hypothetical protein D6C81_05249 [Aureobasidium pullulans]|nr:hypothetical protein D6C81_05249 [Aureobasidium pullulans]
MAEKRPTRYSPPTSRMNNLPNLGSLSPIGQPNGTSKLGAFTTTSDTLSQLPGLSPTIGRRNNHRNSEPSDTSNRWTIRIRRLPPQFGEDALRSMLIFATDLDGTKFVHSSDSLEDSGFSTATATFHSEAGAMEAKDRLHGKPFGKNGIKMIVELLPDSQSQSQSAYNGSRRNTVDGTAARQQTGSGGSSNGSEAPLSRQSSRFSTSWGVSSPLTSPPVAVAQSFEFPAPDSSNHIQSIFSPQSPHANGYPGPNRISGKSVINDGNDDDETGELLKDPVGYAKNGRNALTGHSNPVPQFGNLSVETGAMNGSGYPHYVTSPTSPNYTSPHSMRSPPLPASSRPSNVTTNGSFSHKNLRHDFPPANPADQHPPCNTLYVGNLPLHTSEDELKSLFSKARGFKRLCFRTKANGPMCFVEFEDVTYASHALHELYGVQLHNSYKGGIRVSFSKNPLGVRSDNPKHSMSPHAGHPGFSNGTGPGFSTAAGPPPGLMAPGLHGPPPQSPPPPMLQHSNPMPPMQQNSAIRGFTHNFRSIPPQSHSQPGMNSYPQASRNISPVQYSNPAAFSSMNSFMDCPPNATSYSNGSGHNGYAGYGK